METLQMMLTTSPLNRQILIVVLIIAFFVFKKVSTKALDAKSYKVLSEEEFMTKGKNKITDIRMANDFEFDHIQGARNLPMMDLRTKPLNWPKNGAIFLYGYSEKDASKAARFLYKKGYLEIYVLKGGLVPFTGATTGRLTKEMEIATPKGREL